MKNEGMELSQGIGVVTNGGVVEIVEHEDDSCKIYSLIKRNIYWFERTEETIVSRGNLSARDTSVVKRKSKRRKVVSVKNEINIRDLEILEREEKNVCLKGEMEKGELAKKARRVLWDWDSYGKQSLVGVCALGATRRETKRAGSLGKPSPFGVPNGTVRNRRGFAPV